jgi:hypothetical protein
MEHILMYQVDAYNNDAIVFWNTFQFVGFYNKIAFFKKGLKSTTCTWNFSKKNCKFKI